VAVLVVYRLELVEVEYCQGEPAPFASGPGCVLGEAFLPGPAVEDAGEVVLAGQLLQRAQGRVEALDGGLHVGHEPARPVGVRGGQFGHLAPIQVAAQGLGGTSGDVRG
jgi:hypothetical protein